MSADLERHVADYAYAYPEEFRLALRRAKVGARVLDRHESGWEQRVDLDQLDLTDNCRCVLGQVFDPQMPNGGSNAPTGYTIGSRFLGLHLYDEGNDEGAVRCGFDAGYDLAPADTPEGSEYDTLDAAWLRILLDRKADQ